MLERFCYPNSDMMFTNVFNYAGSLGCRVNYRYDAAMWLCGGVLQKGDNTLLYKPINHNIMQIVEYITQSLYH